MDRRTFFRASLALSVVPFFPSIKPSPSFISDSWDGPSTDVVGQLKKLREQWEKNTGYVDQRYVDQHRLWLFKYGSWDVTVPTSD